MNAPIFRVGDSIRLKSARDRIGVIIGEPRAIAGDWWYPVVFATGDRLNVLEIDLEAATGARDVRSLLEEGTFGAKETLSKLVTYAKLAEPLRDHLYALHASRTRFYEYQFKPLVKFLQSPAQRLLIADEVGLGKTIEAGLILIELRARQLLHRVLVVCTSSLRGKWQEELRRRFDEEFEIADTSRIRRLLRDWDERGEELQFKVIASLQAMRNRKLLDDLEALSPSFDLVIIDEAHHMRNPGTLANRLGRILTDAAEAMLLLTATPIHLGNENLFHLLRILVPDEFDSEALFAQRIRANDHVVAAERILRHMPPDLAGCRDTLARVEQTAEAPRFSQNPLYHEVQRKLTAYDPNNPRDIIEIQRDLSEINLLAHILNRTRKREVQVHSALRTPKIVQVEFTAEEMEFYEAVTKLVIAKCQLHGDNVAAVFATVMPQRQAASCIPAAVEKYVRAHSPETLIPRQEESDLTVEDLTDEDIESAEVPPEVTEAVRRMAASARALKNVDSKFDALLGILRDLDKVEPGRKLVIFSYFKGTLAYLARRLASFGYRSVVLTGDVPSHPEDPLRDERGHRLAAFRDDPNMRILLSSEVGSEGLDFQFCHILINYDLPWNPMVVEQRIGRLDRIGQESERILIFNLSVIGTIEDRILRRLYQRIRIFEQSLGDLEAILGEEVRQLTLDLLRSRLTPEEQERRMEQAAAAIERRRQMHEEMEERAGQFLAHDAFFTEEMGRIRSLRRYLSAEELEVFVSEFLRMNFPRCVLEPSERPQCFELAVTAELEHHVRASVPSDDMLLRQFLRRIQRRRVTVTFQSDVAYARPEVEFLNAHHPLARAIRRHYESRQDELYPVAKIRLPQGPVAGEFVYLLYKIDTRAIRSGRELEAVFVGTVDGEALDPDQSEVLVSEMVTSGKTLPTHPPLTRGRIGELIHRGEETFVKRLNKKKAELQLTNDALVASRLASLEQSFHNRLRRKKEQLSGAKERRREPRYIRMLEGTIRNLEADYLQKKQAIDATREVSTSFDLIAGGIVRVEDGN